MYGWRLRLLLLPYLDCGFAHWHKDFTAACKICLNIPEMKMCYNVQWHSKAHCNMWIATAGVIFPFLAMLPEVLLASLTGSVLAWLTWGKLPTEATPVASPFLLPWACPRTAVLCACTADSTAAGQGSQAQSSTHMKQRADQGQNCAFMECRDSWKVAPLLGFRAPIVSLCCKNGEQTLTKNSPQLLWQGFHV